MTIAVVGATGNTGRAVVKELKALGQNPVCIVRNADNVLAGFEREADARCFFEAMRERLAAFALLFRSLTPLKRAMP